MTASFDGEIFTLTGATPVTVADAPAGQTEVFSLFGHNYDSVSQTLIAKKVQGAEEIEVGRIVLGAGESGQFLKTAVVLKAADETVTVEMLGAHTTTAPKVDVSMCKVTA